MYGQRTPGAGQSSCPGDGNGRGFGALDTVRNLLTARGMRCESTLASFVLGAVLLAGGCASGDGDSLPPDGDDYVLSMPTLEAIAPTQIALGDTVKVFGENFVPKQHGTLGLYLDGEYVDADGNVHPFEGEVQLEVQNSSVAEFPFEQIFFHPSQNEIGTWRGTAMLVNRMPSADDINSDEELWSEDRDVSLRVLPSVLIHRLRSADSSNCALVTSATNSEHNIELGFKALGLGEASPENPWEVRVSFVSPEVTAYFVTPDLFDDGIPVWPLGDLEHDQSVASLASPGNHRISFDMTSGNTVTLDPTRTARKVSINPPITIGQQVLGEVYLGKVAAGPIEFGGKSTANFLVEVFTSDGRELRRVISMDVFSEFEIGFWDGDERLAQRYTPHATSGCVTCSPNGPICTVEYSEGESLSRSRSISVRWDSNVQQSLGFQAGNFNILQANASQSWSQSFGVDINEQVTSESHENRSVSVQVIPSFAAMSYRQLERMERTVDVIYHNECGASGVVGQAVLTNWNFGFEVATGEDCPPGTNLPPAQTWD